MSKDNPMTAKDINEEIQLNSNMKNAIIKIDEYIKSIDNIIKPILYIIENDSENQCAS